MRNIILKGLLLFICMQFTSCEPKYKFNIPDDYAEINLLITTIKKNNLEHKEDFYKRLLAMENIEYQKQFYDAEKEVFKKEMQNAADLEDLQLAMDTQIRFGYLIVLARDTNGNIVNKNSINPKNKDTIVYSIEKYDPISIELLKTVKRVKQTE